MGNAGPGMLSATMLDAERSRNQPAARGVSLYVLRRSRLRLLYTLPAHNGGCCGSLNRPWRPRGILARSGHPNHHGNNAGAAIVGGLIGLGIGAAIASRGYYAPPPPVYYGAPPGYYAPPPAVYYGY